MDYMTFTEELLTTTREAMEHSKRYLEAREMSSKCFNELQVLIYKAGLHTSKKSPENKIIELMADKEFGGKAREVNELMNKATAEYKGLELVCKTYLAHSSALQSCIKTQISGEIAEATKNKYNGFN